MADKTTPKVVSIKGFMKPSKAVRLLQACSELASDGLAESLARMMGQVDDALFELAEKAENNVIQTLYFDAMREVRRKRKDIESAFRDCFLSECHTVIEEGPRNNHDQSSALSLEGGLSLVEDNHLETSLAVTNMVAKVHHQCKEELFALDTRVALLLGKAELREEENPFNPTLICNAFKTACEELDADIKVRLIILKLFERFVVPDLRQVYKRINEHLAQNNILPRINYAIQRQPGSTPAAYVNQPADGGAYFDDSDPFATMQQLLVQRQGRELEDEYRNLARTLIAGIEACYREAGQVRLLRIHGDCHPGNILWTVRGPCIVDFDDVRMGPAVQDLWMFLSGEPDYMRARLEDLLTGYGVFRDFDWRELRLVEALRAMRMMHYAAWLARRWDDPAFPRAFPWFNSRRYWEEHIVSLREQVAALESPPLGG